jgi:hypothetical protein
VPKGYSRYEEVEVIVESSINVEAGKTSASGTPSRSSNANDRVVGGGK